MIRYISKEERDMAQSILIVDDERDIVSMLNQYFCKIGYVVYTAINGKEALNAITKHPDIILLDINMPDMNGSSASQLLPMETKSTIPPSRKLSATCGSRMQETPITGIET